MQVDMPPKLNRFNVGLYNKIKKQEKDATLWENTKLVNCLAQEIRKLKSTQMKLKRLQEKVCNNYKLNDFYFISLMICLFLIYLSFVYFTIIFNYSSIHI